MHLPNYNDARRRDNKDYKRVDFKFDEDIKPYYTEDDVKKGYINVI